MCGMSCGWIGVQVPGTGCVCVSRCGVREDDISFHDIISIDLAQHFTIMSYYFFARLN